jgi:hypothetical protein
MARPMKWRMFLAVLLGLALPLPLAWLLYTSFLGRIEGEEVNRVLPQGVHLVPMLTLEERRRVPTYERRCESDADCDPQLRCFWDMRAQRSYCTDSKCMSDEQCPEGFSCRFMTPQNDKDVLRFCSLVGVRGEGELCVMLPLDRDYGCRRDLSCHGLCGRPCELDNPTSCPEGFFCEEDPAGATCMPTCEGRTCPEGQRCISRGKRVSMCARVFGPDCLQNPCASGQDCVVSDHPEVANALWMQCLKRCSALRDAPCPDEGTVCLIYRCRKSCTKEDPSACPPGFACEGRPEEPLTCVPSAEAARGN